MRTALWYNRKEISKKIPLNQIVAEGFEALTSSKNQIKILVDPFK